MKNPAQVFEQHTLKRLCDAEKIIDLQTGKDIPYFDSPRKAGVVDSCLLSKARKNGDGLLSLRLGQQPMVVKMASRIF